MSTPVRPRPYPSDRSIRNSVIRRPTRERKKRVASPIRYSPISRRAPKEVTNAPKAKRVRQSRLTLDKFIPYDNNSPRPSGVVSPQQTPLTRRRFHLPIQRLQFENEDFMDMYNADDNNRDQRHRPDSVAFLSQCLSNAFNTVIKEPPMTRKSCSPRLSTLRPRSALRTPEYRSNRKATSSKLTPRRMHAAASDKEN